VDHILHAGDIAYMRGMPTEVHTALVLRAPNGSPNVGDEMRVARSVHQDLADFAGHAGTGLEQLYFMTRPLPPLAAEDGFESLTDATFAGVQVLSGPSAIAGTKSLYIPPTNTMPPTQPELALRLPVAAGDTVLRFAYRKVRLSSTSFSYGSAWALGSVGHTGTAPALPADDGAAVDTGMIGDWTVMLGPVTTASADGVSAR